MRNILSHSGAALIGIVAGILVWTAVLNIQVRRYEPGLWSARSQRILICGLDYNGPPYTDGPHHLWLTCGDEDSGWRLWPLR